MSFGWSVGDLVTAIDVIWKVVDALRETGGSATKYQETDLWLNSVAMVLMRLQENPGSASAGDVIRIRDAVFDFRKELRDKYGDTLGPKSSSSWKQSAVRKVDMLKYRATVENKVKVLRSKVDASLGTISLHLGIDIQETVQDTNKTAHAILDMQEGKERQDDEDSLARVLTWLNPVVATQKKFDDCAETNVDGSGQWLLQTEAYRQWLSAVEASGQVASEDDKGVGAARRLLWITGIPGSGKTCLATSLVQAFQTEKRRRMCKTAFFYCESREHKTTSLHAILRTWLWQLMQQCDPRETWSAKELRDMAWTCKAEPEPSEATLKSMLLDLLARERNTDSAVVLVLDGLDECAEGDRKAFITRVLPAVLPLAPCAVFSRLSNDLVRLVAQTLPPHMYRRLHISPADTVRDMQKFSARELGQLEDTSAALEQELMQAFERRANGMFLWVTLMVRSLQDVLPDDYLVETEKAPEELGDLYHGILTDIWKRLSSQTARRHSKFVLQLLACAARPLSLVEIATALQVTVDEPTFRHGKGGGTSSESGLTLAKLLGFCGSLVTVTNSTTNPVVSLVHASAREYLLDPDNRGEVFGDLIVDEQASHGLLARICLTYLCYDGVPEFPYLGNVIGPKKENEQDKDYKPRRETLAKTSDAYLDRIPLQRYATTQWAWHVLASENPVSRETAASLLRLCRSEASTIRWAQTALFVLIDRASIAGRGTQDDTTLLAPICQRFGNDDEARRVYADWLFHLTGDRAKRTFSRWTRLMMPGEGDRFPSDVHVAAHFDFVDYLRAYLEAGGDPNRPTVTNNRPLHAAAHCESVASAKLLLEHGADADAPGFADITPLGWGMGITPPHDIHTGHFDVAGVLLDAGADPFAGPTEETMAFCRAINMAMTELPPDSSGRARLAADDPQVMELLTLMLEHSNTAVREHLLRRFSNSRRLLFRTIQMGAFSLAQFLLAHGADINFVDIGGRTALDVARALDIDGAEEFVRGVGGKTAAEIQGDASDDEDADSHYDRDGGDGSLDEDRTYWPAAAADVFQTYLVLQRLLSRSAAHGGASRFSRSAAPSRAALHAIIVRILDAAGYWLKLTTSRHDEQPYDEDRGVYDPVYLTTPPLLGRQQQPVRQLCFHLASHDQGWASGSNSLGTYEQSYTWFSFDVVAASPPADGAGVGAGGRSRGTKRTNKPVGLTPNVRGYPDTTHHRLTFFRDGTVHPAAVTSPDSERSDCGIVPLMQVGDHIVVYAKALYPFWVNVVESVRVDIYTTCLLDALRK